MNKASRIASLDGLRAIAIALVISGHSAGAYGGGTGLLLVPLINDSFGVRLFFVLSGFLITKLLMREQDNRGRISLRYFYIRRALRIFPAFYLYITVVAILAAAGIVKVSGQQFFAAATYSWNYLGIWHTGGPSEGAWFFGHLWTLSLEEQFYIFWPICIVAAGWRSARWVSLFVPLMLPLLRVIWYWAYPEHRGFLGMMFHTAIDSILIGCAFAVWEKWLPRWLSDSRMLLSGVLVFTFLISPIIAEIVRPYRITVGFGLEGVGAGILILQALRGGGWGRLLSWPPFVLIGTWSYSLYLWQQLFLTRYNETFTGKLPWSLACVILCAIASYYLVEMPFLRLKGRFERARIDDRKDELKRVLEGEILRK